MTEHERMMEYLWDRGKGSPMCANCKHYHQHYGYIETGELIELNIGHCAHPRMKTRIPYDVCIHFEAKEDKT